MKQAKLRDYFYVFVLFIFNDSLFFGGIINNSIVYKIAIFCLVLGYFILTNFKKLKIDTNKVAGLFILIIFLILNMIVTNDKSNGYVYIFMIIIVGYIVSEVMDIKRFANVSINIMVFLSIYSIIVFFTQPLWRIIEPHLIHYDNEAGVPMINFIFSTHVNLPNYQRLFGIFRESGVYQIFLNISLIYILFSKKEINIFKVVVILLTVMLTYSTPGYIAVFLIFIAKFLGIKNKKDFFSKYKLLTLLLILCCIGAVLLSMFYEPINSVFSKLLNKESSYSGRTTSILVELELWFKKPVFGYGIQNGMALSKELGEIKLGEFMFNTSTFTGLLVNFGVIITGYLFYNFGKFFIKIVGKNIALPIVLLAVILVFSSQLMIYNAYFYTIVFFGMTRIKKKEIY